jgi:autotransporter adhesin
MDHGIAIGKNATASGGQGIAIGGGSNGEYTTASGQQSIAIGANVVSSGDASIAIGGDDLDDASEYSINEIFKGYTGSNIIEDEYNRYDGHTESKGAASVAIGVKARSEGNLSTAVGVRSSSSGAASSAFGMGASASRDGSVALGAGSTTLTDATKEMTMSVGGVSYSVAGAAQRVGDQVSVGSVGRERQIKHVAAGAVNANSTDAINGSQLHATNTVVNKGFGLKAADGNTVMKPLGGQVEVVGSNSNITTKVVDGKIAVALNNDLDLGTTGSVEMGNAGFLNLGPVTTVNRLGVFTGNVLGSTAVTGAGIIVNGPLGIPSTTLTTNGLNIIGGPSVTRSGIDTGNKRIIRVSNGIDPTDAVNVSQLTGSATASRTEVEAGTNVAVTNVLGANGQNVYTVNADGTTASAGSTAVTVNAGAKDANNVTDYAVDLSQASKDSLVKADNSVQYDNAVTRDVVTLGGVGATAPVTLTNVKAGTTEFDAVNYGQLEAQSNDITTKGLNFAGNLGDDIHKDLGQKLEIVGTLDASKTASAKNIRTVANEGKLEIQLADDLDVASVTTGNSLLNNVGLQVGTNVFITNQGLQAGNTYITNTGLTFAGSTVAVTAGGINAGGKKITNVDDGLVESGSKEAVNGGQLQEVKDTAANANKGWKISAAGGTSTTVAPGTAVDFNSKDSNITVSKNAESNDVSFELNRDLDLDSATFGDVSISSANGLNNGGKTITNVGDGLIEAGSMDAINGGQLNQVISNIDNSTSILVKQMDAGMKFGADNVTGDITKSIASIDTLRFEGGNNITTTSDGSNNIKFDLNGNINVESVTTGNTTVSTNGVAIAGGPRMISTGIYAGTGETAPSMTADGINAAGNNITNVADGMAPRDAVNFSQLDAVSVNLGNSINELGYKIGEVEDDANSGISAAMAMSSLPQAYIVGKSMIGGGIATYNGESAVAIGFSKLSTDGRWVMKLNGTADTQGNVGAAIGAGFHFD